MGFCEYWYGIVRPFIGPAVGLIVTAFAFSPFVRRLVRATKDELSFDDAITDRRLRERWKAIAELHPAKGPRYLGYFERTIFFIAVSTSQYEIAAGWLAFKLAAKWQSWEHVAQIPSTLKSLMNDIQFLHVRHIWGTRLLSAFLVGTAANVVAAFIGHLLAVVVNFYLTR